MEPYNKPQADPSARELAGQVGQTRSAITSDIRELGDKLSPSQLKEEAKGVAKDFALGAKEVVVDKAIEVKDAVVDKAVEVKDAIVDKTAEVAQATAEKFDEAKEAVSEALDDAGETAARIGRATWRFTSANAVPLALVGIGAGWMIANNRASRPQRVERFDMPRRSELAARRSALPAEPLELTDAEYDEPAFAGNGSRATKRTRERQQRGSVRPHARREVDDLIQQGKDSATRGAEMARNGFVRAKEASRDFAEANPLALAMATLALGLGVGLLLPATDPETKLLAPAREKFDRMIGDARDAASDVVEIAKETANESISRS